MRDETVLADVLLDRLPNGSVAVFDREYRYSGKRRSPPGCPSDCPFVRLPNCGTQVAEFERMAEWLKRNGLSVALAIMFVVAFAGQAIAGLLTHNQELAEHGQPTISLGAYLLSAHFFEATFENWESEFLQMAVFVLLTAVLYQPGSSESKRPGVFEPVDVDPREVTLASDAPWPVRRGGLWLKLYEQSLGLAFALLFFLSVAGHAISGAAEHNADAGMHGGETITVIGYLAEPRFWFESFQNWQSEFLALVAMVVLSIFLRQRGSPESKPVYAPHSETGR